MGVENVPLKDPMDNPEEWIEKVIAELSSVEPEEAAVSSESAEHSMPAGNAEHEEAGLHGLPDSAVAAVAEATGSAVIPEVIPDRIPDREEAALRFERLRKEHLPKGMFAHFLLTDIQAPVREMRGIPRYLRLEACCTVIGRHAGARIFLDDEKTVEPMHARVVYEQREKSAEFVLYPLKGAPVLVNGREIPSEGVVCNSGDGVQIGSAHLIFFAKNTAESAGARTG